MLILMENVFIPSEVIADVYGIDEEDLIESETKRRNEEKRQKAFEKSYPADDMDILTIHTQKKD